jgi:hypothetical protein
MIGTKRQAREVVAMEAQRCGMPFVDQRWLGGMLTNFKTVKGSLKKLKDMQATKEAGMEQMIKKEALLFDRELAKLEKDIGGIQDMSALPDAMFVIDVGYHKIAVAEAKKLGIPVIGVVDTNHSPVGIDYVIPATTTRPRPWRCMPAPWPTPCSKARPTPPIRGGAGGRRQRRVRRSPRRSLSAPAGLGPRPEPGPRPPRMNTGPAGSRRRRLFERRTAMPAITASMVAELRAKTDAPMMECKKALTEADGDMGRAEEILRVKLGNKAGKAAARITAEGVIAAARRRQHRRAGRSQLRNRLRLQERLLPGLRQGLRRAGGRAQPGRRGRAVGAAAGAGRLRPDGGRRAQGPDRQDRREHVDPPLQALRRRRPAGPLPARHAHRRDRRVRRRRRGRQGRGHARGRHEAQGAVVGRRAGRAGREVERRSPPRRAEDSAAESGKAQSPEIVAKMVEGSVQKFLKEVSLLNQALRQADDKQTVEQMLKEKPPPR